MQIRNEVCVSQTRKGKIINVRKWNEHDQELSVPKDYIQYLQWMQQTASNIYSRLVESNL